MLLEQVLIEQAHIDHQAKGHERVHGRLELQEQVHVQPALFSAAYPPEHVALPAAHAGRDEARRNSLQGGEVELADPFLVDEAADQVRHHFGMREQRLVAGIVLRHRTSLRHGLRKRRHCRRRHDRAQEQAFDAWFSTKIFPSNSQGGSDPWGK
jgi:hypothetical protein